MTEQKQENWELIAKTLLLAIAIVVVGGVCFWQGMRYSGGDFPPQPQPWPTPFPTPTPYPQPDAEVWYRAPRSVTRCLPTTFCDGISRPGWIWQINRIGVLRFAPPVWGGENGGEVMSEEMLNELRGEAIGDAPPAGEIKPIPDPNT